MKTLGAYFLTFSMMFLFACGGGKKSYEFCDQQCVKVCEHVESVRTKENAKFKKDDCLSFFNGQNAAGIPCMMTQSSSEDFNKCLTKWGLTPGMF